MFLCAIRFLQLGNKHFNSLKESKAVFTCPLLCQQLRDLLLRNRERRLLAASAPPRWRCTARISAASAKYLPALQHQELRPAVTKSTQNSDLYITFFVLCPRTQSLRRKLRN